MRIFNGFKRWKAVGFLIVLMAANGFLSFLLEPANGASERMWKGYYKQEDLDMIFVGSSVSQQTFIPEIFDENLGINTYNMGTPSQAIPQTMRAIEVAEKEHDIKTVIFGMGFSSLKYEPIPEAELTFESARTRQKGGIGGLFDTLSYIYSDKVRGTEDSINFLFPWLYNYENYFLETFIENATLKMQRLGKESIEDSAKGFRNDDTRVFNYDNKWTSNTDQYYESYFNAEMLAEFEELLQFCKSKEIELIVVNTPHPSFDVISCYEYYQKNQEQFVEYCKKYGAAYYDFSLAKPEIFENIPQLFCDYEHLNRQGAEIFCQKLSEFLNRRAAGENMEQYFYSVEEFYEIHAEELSDWKEWNE